MVQNRYEDLFFLLISYDKHHGTATLLLKPVKPDILNEYIVLNGTVH